MTRTIPAAGIVIGGIDTHGHTHHAAVLDHVGRQLGDREFPTTPAGYQALGTWLGRHGQLERVGIEGTGTYGAGPRHPQPAPPPRKLPTDTQGPDSRIN
jgi:hypothetical protein